jgi:hypothetical protein
MAVNTYSEGSVMNGILVGTAAPHSTYSDGMGASQECLHALPDLSVGRSSIRDVLDASKRFTLR